MREKTADIVLRLCFLLAKGPHRATGQDQRVHNLERHVAEGRAGSARGSQNQRFLSLVGLEQKTGSLFLQPSACFGRLAQWNATASGSCREVPKALAATRRYTKWLRSEYAPNMELDWVGSGQPIMRGFMGERGAFMATSCWVPLS